jgi:murein DD-endopeptidase MepM/ murein hydrolase activator NlpD
VASEVPDNDGVAPSTIKQGDRSVFLPVTFDPEDFVYRVFILRPDLTRIDITDYLNTGTIEEQPGEFAVRMRATFVNDMLPSGTFVRDVLANGARIEVYCDWGVGAYQDMFWGWITTAGGTQTITITAYDDLHDMLKSQGNFAWLGVLPDDPEGTEGALASAMYKDIANHFNFQIIDQTLPDVAVGDQIFRNKSIGSMLTTLGEAVWESGGGEWFPRYIPNAATITGPNEAILGRTGAVEIVQPGQNKIVYFLDDQIVKLDPDYEEDVSEMVTVVKAVYPDKNRINPNTFIPGSEVVALTIINPLADPAKLPAGKPPYRTRVHYIDVDQYDVEQAEIAAQVYLNVHGRPVKIRRFEAPDMPWLRRWDRVIVRAGVLDGEQVIEGITHDLVDKQMLVNVKDTSNLLFPEAFVVPRGEIPEGLDRRLLANQDALVPGTGYLPASGKGLWWPFPGEPNVDGGFDWLSPTGGTSGGIHKGVDLNPYPEGGFVYCAGPGFVEEAVDGYDNAESNGNGYGNYVKVRHGNTGLHTLYGHLVKGTVMVSVGQAVVAGQELGKEGNSGTAGGVHLHFEVQQDRSTAYAGRVRPYDYCEVWTMDMRIIPTDESEHRPPTETSDGYQPRRDIGDLLRLIDKHTAPIGQFNLPDAVGFPPGPYTDGTHQLRSDAAAALEGWFVAANAEGFYPKIISSYRTFDQQASTFQKWVDLHGEEQAERESARPGHSEHQLGRTVDITMLDQGYFLTAEGEWMRDNAATHGFVLSYPEGAEAERRTGYMFEPWHWRYIGITNAYNYTQAHAARGVYLNEWLLEQDKV